MTLKITVTGAPNSGKTTAARLIQLALEEAGYTDIHVTDLPPQPHGKGDFEARWAKNKTERVDIVVEAVVTTPGKVCSALGGDREGHVCRLCRPEVSRR